MESINRGDLTVAMRVNFSLKCLRLVYTGYFNLGDFAKLFQLEDFKTKISIYLLPTVEIARDRKIPLPCDFNFVATISTYPGQVETAQ